MERDNEERTSFITKDGAYCYRAFSFSVKNVGAAYQWLMNEIFKDQIGKNVEVYIDSMIVKSKSFEKHIVDQ